MYKPCTSLIASAMLQTALWPRSLKPRLAPCLSPETIRTFRTVTYVALVHEKLDKPPAAEPVHPSSKLCPQLPHIL